MTRLFIEENPWLEDESCQSLDNQTSDSYEKKPNAFFLEVKDDTFSGNCLDKLQKIALNQLPENSVVSSRFEWTSPKPEFINFLLTNEELQQSKLLNQAQLVNLVASYCSLDKEFMLEVLRTYQTYLRTGVRSMVKPQKRFTLTALEKDEVENLKQEEEKAYLEKQARLFDACKESLLKTYEDRYVLFEDGAVLDSGESRAEVAMRAYQNFGMKPLFIEKVVSEAESLAAVWTPFPLSE